MLKPIFSEFGMLIGYEMRPELAKVMFCQKREEYIYAGETLKDKLIREKEEIVLLNRVTRACLQLN